MATGTNVFFLLFLSLSYMDHVYDWTGWLDCVRVGVLRDENSLHSLIVGSTNTICLPIFLATHSFPMLERM